MDIDVYSDKSDPSIDPDALIGELEDPEIIVKIGTAAAKIAYHNFEWRFVTLIMFNTMLRIGVDTFVQVYNRSVYLKLGKFVPRHRVHVPQFVLFGQDAAELSEILQWLVQNRYDNTAMYIVACSSANYDRCDENDIFKTFSRLHMANVIFLKAPEQGNDPLLFTYYPVLPGKCTNNKPSLIELTNCSRDVCFKNMYPEKYKNLHKCALVVSTLEQPPFMLLTQGANGSLHPSGADGDIVKLVSEILNATLLIRTPDPHEWGHYKDNNWTGSLGDVFNKRAHLSSCSAPLTPQIYGNFQISLTYATIDIVWAARLPPPLPPYTRLIYPLKLYTRIALFAIFILIIFLNFFLKTNLWAGVRHVVNIGPTNVSIFFYSWALYLGLPLVKLPSKQTLRTIVVSWIWFCYVIRTAYQAALYSTMKVQLYYTRLQSFDDVMKMKFPFGGLESLRDYYSEDKEIFDNWALVKLSESYFIIDQLLDGTSDFVLALNKEFMIHNMMRYNGTKRLQTLREKIVNSPAVFFFKKFAPLRSQITHILSNIVEGGIVDMIYSRYLERGDYLFHHQEISSAKPLTIYHVSSSFIILLIGWTLSIIYFGIEILSKKYERRGHNALS